jgi:hypothetical protein
MLGNFDAGRMADIHKQWLSAAKCHPLNPVTGSPDSSVPIGSASVQLGAGAFSCECPSWLRSDREIDIRSEHHWGVRLEFQYIVHSQDETIDGTYDAFSLSRQPT